MRVLIVAVVAAMLSGCGVYVHRGGGGYTFIGPGSFRVAKRCSPYAQFSWWNPNYDYSKMGKEETP